jgi:hypothetical protein
VALRKVSRWYFKAYREGNVVAIRRHDAAVNELYQRGNGWRE